MSNHQCVMSYAQDSSVGTTSTFVPQCRKETPDRLAVCTVERRVTQRLPLTWGGEPSTTGPQQPQGPQGGEAEPHGQDHPLEPPGPQRNQEGRTASTIGPQQPHGPQKGMRDHTMGGDGRRGGVATMDHIYICVRRNHGECCFLPLKRKLGSDNNETQPEAFL